MFYNVEQMKPFSILLLAMICLSSCKSKPTNQIVNKKREGIWIEKYAIDSAQYQSIGNYKHDDPTKKWKYYLNGEIIKKERYHKKYCQTKTFHQNGMIQAKGKTRLDQNGKEMHWYYSGNWKYYDDQGKLITIRQYNNGELISEKKTK